MICIYIYARILGPPKAGHENQRKTLMFLNSIFLENYAPLIIPFNTVCGILLSEKGVLYRNFDLIGIFLLITGFLLFFDRLYKNSLTGAKKVMLPVSLFLVLGSYLSIVFIFK